MSTATDMEREAYYALTVNWAKSGVKVPVIEEIGGRIALSLTVADEIFSEISDADPWLGPLAIPPTRELLEAMKGRVRLPKNFEPETHDDWRIMLVDGNEECGLSWGTANYINENRRMVAGHDVTRLGIVEYAALALQTQGQIDLGTFSITQLLKDQKGDLVPFGRTEPVGVSYGYVEAGVRYADPTYFRIGVDIPQA